VSSFIFDRYQFASGFTAAAVAVGKAQNATRNVLFQVADGKMRFVGTDSHVSVVWSVACDQPAMEFLLPTQRVQAILREAKDDTIQIEVLDKAIVIKVGGSRFRLATEDVREFPPVVVEMPSACWEIESHVFRTACRRTTFAIDGDSTRYALGGVLIEEDGNFVSSDTRRLCVQQASLSRCGGVAPTGQTNVVPERVLSLVERLVQDGDPVRISLSENTVLIQTGGTIVSAQKLAGRFPRWRDVMPRYQDSLSLPVGGLTAALRKSVICTSEECRGVWMKVRDGVLRLESQAASIGESAVELVVQDGVEFSVRVDPKYLLDMLKSLPSEETVEMFFRTADDALLFVRDGYRYVLMPLTGD
jgi:DNA polymerase-3 subunit beta